MSIETLHASLTNEIRGSTNRDQRKLANNTYGRIDETVGGFNAITIRLHATDIAVITPTTARYNTGGWFTVTTKERINRWMPQGFKVASEKGVWHVWQYPGWRKASRFYDGIMLTDTPGPVKVVDPQLDDPDEPLRKALDRYVKLYTDERLAELVEHAVESGTNGDCLPCQMGNDTAFGGDHLLLHIAEDYTMVTLAANAVEAAGYKTDIYLGAFHPDHYPSHWGRSAGETVRRSIRKYLKARVLNRGLSLPELEESYA